MSKVRVSKVFMTGENFAAGPNFSWQGLPVGSECDLPERFILDLDWLHRSTSTGFGD